jgi:hypothetical protein
MNPALTPVVRYTLIVIAAFVLVGAMAVVYAWWTAEPKGSHHFPREPRPPLHVKAGQLLASAAAWAAACAAAMVLLLLAAAARVAAAMLRLRFTLPRGAETAKRGDLPVLEEAGQVPDAIIPGTTLGAPQTGRVPGLDDTRTDMAAIGSGTEAAR